MLCLYLYLLCKWHKQGKKTWKEDVETWLFKHKKVTKLIYLLSFFLKYYTFEDILTFIGMAFSHQMPSLICSVTLHENSIFFSNIECLFYVICFYMFYWNIHDCSIRKILVSPFYRQRTPRFRNVHALAEGTSLLLAEPEFEARLPINPRCSHSTCQMT